MKKPGATPDAVVVSVKMTRELRKRLRIQAAGEERDLQVIVAEAIEAYLKKHGA